MNNACHICDAPFRAREVRFLHMIKHVQDGVAVGSFDGKGNWWFRKKTEEEKAESVFSPPPSMWGRFVMAAKKLHRWRGGPA